MSNLRVREKVGNRWPQTLYGTKHNTTDVRNTNTLVAMDQMMINVNDCMRAYLGAYRALPRRKRKVTFDRWSVRGR